MYQSDPILFRLTRELERARVAFANAASTDARRDEARKRHDSATTALERYQAAASLLSERERQYAITSGLGALELLRARQRLPSDYYERAIDRAPSCMSIRECLAALARVALAASPLPAAAADDAKVIANTQRALEAIGQAIRDNKFDALMGSSLASAAKALAAARGEDPGPVAALVDAVKQAIRARDAGAARRALEQIAEHFAMGIDAPPPTVSTARASTGPMRRSNRGIAFGPSTPIMNAGRRDP